MSSPSQLPATTPKHVAMIVMMEKKKKNNPQFPPKKAKRMRKKTKMWFIHPKFHTMPRCPFHPTGTRHQIGGQPPPCSLLPLEGMLSILPHGTVNLAQCHSYNFWNSFFGGIFP